MTHPYVHHTLLAYAAQYPHDTERLQSTSALLAQDDIISRKNMVGHVTATLLVLNPERTHVLTIFHNHHGKRLNPGGHIDENGDPFEAALREGEEEAGLPLNGVEPLATWDPLSCAIDIDAHGIKANPKKNEGDHVHHDVMYATVLKPGVQLVPVHDEGASQCEWTPLEEWAQSDARHRRVLNVLQEPRYAVFLEPSPPSP